MPEPTIVFAPLLEADVRAIADELKPAELAFRNVAPPDAPEAIHDADFLCGFVGHIETDVLSPRRAVV